MRIVVTGASGFVGMSLVPLLAEAGAELLLVGRDPARIRQAFPVLAACGYGELARRGAGFDVLVHLAVANNDAALAPDAFRAVNVDLALETAESARQAGIGRFVNVSSIRALDPGDDSSYARTKREAVERLAGIAGSADAVTDIGLILRQTKLDELPQIWNILRNEVSLIGRGRACRCRSRSAASAAC